MSLKRIGRFVVGGLAVLGALVVAGSLAILIAIWLGRAPVPERTILDVDFEGNLIEYIPEDPIARLMLKDTLALRDVLDAMKKASTDDRVVALVARIGSGNMGMAQIQELRDAVMAFRRSGRPAIAHAESFGEFAPGNGAYYLATAFDEIYLQASGDLGLTGLIAETPFFEGTLEKLRIIPRIDRREKYKTFANILTERGYTQPHRESIRSVIESQYSQIVGGISESRDLMPSKVRALIDQGPFFGRESLNAGFVDGLWYRDQVYERLKGQVGQDAERLSLSEYLERAGRPHTRGETVALIYGVGSIQRGKNRFDPNFRGFTMGSDTITSAFRLAIEDEDVKAIIFRVDSPGGSYVASDAIWREVLLARRAGKPVVVTMGNLAGSGGYYVSMAADKIVAQPGTITGSIGVLGGKVVISDFLATLGISRDDVKAGENAGFWSWTQDYTPAQWDRLQVWLDRVYADFIDKAAEGRGLPRERVLEVAGGRIWTGEEAKALGLVDELGGSLTALRLAKEAAGISDQEDVQIRVFPEKKTVLDMIFDRGEEQTAAELMGNILETARPVMKVLAEIGAVSRRGALSMPEVETVR